MQKANLEWLFRVANEPRRLFKPIFCWECYIYKRDSKRKEKDNNANILHISRTMDIGGAEKIVYQLATDLKEEFDSVHIASTGGLWERRVKEKKVFNTIKYWMLNQNLLKHLRLILEYYVVL